jgi:penicillin-binding protein 1B
LRIRLQKGFWTSRFGLAFLGVVLAGVLAGAGAFTYYWVKFGHMIDQRLSGGALRNTTQIFSAPGHIATGDAMSAEELASYLQRAGYRARDIEGSPGRFSVEGSTVEIWPSKFSYFGGTNALRLQFGGKSIRSIRSLPGGADLSVAEIEPELLTNLFDSAREKRRPVRYEDLPKHVVNAVLSAEDKRFFEHPGFDPVRILGAAWADLRHTTHLQGASTITMQAARSFFFSSERTWRRKLAETMVALELEQRFSKKEIFEMYANEIYLGNRGSFAIHGFGEASLAYFGKDVQQLTLGEAAFLAGIIRAPNYYSSADRRPERAAEARDRVLAQMAENDLATPEEVQAARKAPLRIVRGAVSGNEAPYFVDMVKDHLLDKLSENELLSQNFRVYTTIDPALQRIATSVVESGMKDVDKLLAARYARWRRELARKKSKEQAPTPQVALIALDPRTGAIKALVGGRDYGQSQLNHALARRQPGSSFKPFVYAAAFDNAVDGVNPVVTTATTIVDEPTTFEFDGQEYTPNNFGEKFMGTVTVRDALTHSLNVATVKVAELIGYGRVVQVARQMGLGNNIQPTPAVALGAYEMTPIDVAAGYTIFANLGARAEPQFIYSVVSAAGDTVERFTPRTRGALDPRVAFLVTNVLKDVLNRGTGAAVRARGFTAPAAGKTGTSRDGWFAGFTSNLVCVIWIGFDDNRDLGLSGSQTAAPMWADFMMRATALPAYSNVQDIAAPEGVTAVMIDPETLELATPSCPTTREEVYVTGTAPTQYCERHGGPMLTQVPPASWLSRIFGGGKPSESHPGDPKQANAAGASGKTDGQAGPPGALSTASSKGGNGTQPQAAREGGEKKKNPLRKIFGIFGGKKDKDKDKDKAKSQGDNGESP